MTLRFSQVSITASPTLIASSAGSNANFPTQVIIRKSSATGTVWIGPSTITAVDTAGLAMSTGSLSFTFLLYPGGNDLYGITASGTIVVETLQQP